MNKLMNRLKNVSPKNAKVFKAIATITLVMFFTTFVSSAIGKQDTVLPENPMDEPYTNHSDVSLMVGYKDLMDIEGDSSDSEEKNEEERDEDDEGLEQPEETKNEKNLGDVSKDIDESDGVDEEQSGSRNDTSKDGNQHEGSGGGKNTNSDSSNIEVTENGELDESEYFTTSISDGEIITKPEYSFSVEQLDHTYKVKDIYVVAEPNQQNADITGELDKHVRINTRLTEGDNTLRISVTYEDRDKKTFTVTQTYKVILNENKIVIYTDLENQEVSKEKIKFKASAEKKGESVPVTVTINDKAISNDTNQYSATLLDGKNTIIITADDGKETVTEEYEIHYNKPKLSIETDLQNSTVENSDFTFNAKAFDGGNEIDLSIHHNGNKVESSSDGHYSITLTKNENTIELYTEKGSQSHSETYTVHYKDNQPEGGEEGNDDQNAPSISIPDLKDGQVLKGTTKTFHVSAQDYKGEYFSSIQVTNNGESVHTDWINNDQTSFTLKVQDGENHVVVTATDNEGNSASKSLTVYGDISDGVIGHATISVEASTIGLGYIIPPETVEIHQGDRGSQVIDRLFAKHGITYDYTGTHVNSFYLERMYRSGLVTGAKVPADLAELLERDMGWFDEENHAIDSLGEFDFTNGSGWMYSVNGNYPNVGFADYYFEEGDVVRIRFTLALGSDIGGGMPGQNYSKEW